MPLGVVHDLVEIFLKSWPAVETAVAHYAEQAAIKATVKQSIKLLGIDSIRLTRPKPTVSPLVSYGPLSLGDAETIGLYLAGSLSYGSRAPAMLFVPKVYRHFLTVVQLEVRKAAANQELEVDVMPSLLTFANGLLGALRMGAYLDPGLSIALLEIATAIVNSAKKYVDGDQLLRITGKNFSLRDLKALYRGCLFSHGIAIRAVRMYQIGFDESRCTLLDNRHFLATSPDGSPLLTQWQVTQRARGLAAIGDENGFCEAMREAAANVPSLKQFVKVEREKWPQKQIRSLDPSRSAEAEVEIVKACTCMIGGLFRSLELIANGTSRAGRAQLGHCVRPMMSLAAKADDVWWHGYAHCALVDGVSSLAAASGRPRRDSDRKKAIDSLKSASEIFAATNDRGMADRSALILNEILDSGKLDISFGQANYLYFGRP